MLSALTAFFVSTGACHSFELLLPIDCVIGQSCVIQNYVDIDESSSARDYACGHLTYDGHNGTDFRIPTLADSKRGVNVLAAADGIVERTRDGMDDIGLSQPSPSLAGRECGNGVVISHSDGWETQYCHLGEGSIRVKAGQPVSAGQSIGLVGLSGRTEFPHLHFTVRHNGRVVDPFSTKGTTGSCRGDASLWAPSIARFLDYRAQMVLNSGFSPRPITSEMIETGGALDSTLDSTSPALIGYVRTIGLRAGDVQQMTLIAPDGKIVADHKEAPLDHSKAQSVLFVGIRRPQDGWTAGTYKARYRVLRGQDTVLDHSFSRSF
ncbi:peptidase, family M23/M37 (plasmid) [Afipia carboxidovorans OM5]|uniref:Peptidase, family M23/M37 n=2 Tax=Afipia carboxidovorans TaxID=40137 RepID=F8C0Y6_AFIC5|nr:peptidase, family M23/M37 [Afipia carboxidovorans OM4]AEI08096.1 peptidase, family M23/M37 [Afipia carboxidovorans OM5]